MSPTIPTECTPHVDCRERWLPNTRDGTDPANATVSAISPPLTLDCSRLIKRRTTWNGCAADHGSTCHAVSRSSASSSRVRKSSERDWSTLSILSPSSAGLAVGGVASRAAFSTAARLAISASANRLAASASAARLPASASAACRAASAFATRITASASTAARASAAALAAAASMTALAASCSSAASALARALALHPPISQTFSQPQTEASPPPHVHGDLGKQPASSPPLRSFDASVWKFRDAPCARGTCSLYE